MSFTDEIGIHIKIDDFRFGGQVSSMYYLLSNLMLRRIPFSMGLNAGISNNLNGLDKLLIEKNNNDYDIFFNHSFSHANFLNMHDSDIKVDLNKLVDETLNLGIKKLQYFGAPYNKISVPQADFIKNSLGIPVIEVHAKQWTIITPEFNDPPQFDPVVAHIEKRIENRFLLGHKLMIMQCHPNKWSIKGVESFLEWLDATEFGFFRSSEVF